MRSRRSTSTLVAGGALFAAGLLASNDALAQSPRIFTLAIPMEVEHDSNPALTPSGSGSTTWFRVRPTVTATQVEGQEEFSVEAGLSAEKSSNQAVAQDRLDPRLRGAWKHADPLNTTVVDLLVDRRSVRSTDVREALPVDVDGSRTLVALGGSWRRELSERNAVTSTLRQTWERYSVPDLADYRLTVLSGRFDREMDERSTWYAFGNAQSYRSEEKQDAVLGTVGGTRSESVGLLGGVRRQWSEALLVDVAAGVVHLSRPSSDNEWQGAVHVEYTGPRWTTTFDVSRSAGVNSSVAGLDILDDARLAVRYAIGPLTRMELATGHSRSRLSESKRSVAALSWIRQLGPSWEFSLRAGRQWVEEPGRRADSTTIALALVYFVADL